MKDQVVVVTGSGRGIGRAICLRFAREHAHVIGISRNETDLAETRRLVTQAGGRCDTLAADVGSSEEVEDAMEGVARLCESIHVLVNNAGMAAKGEIESLELDVFNAMVAVNVAGPFYMCRAAWPLLRRAGGAIVNISSIAGIDPFPGFTAYGASKCFVDGLTRGMAREGRPVGIRVFGIAPGAVETQMLRGPFPDFPIDDCLQPSEVADMVWMVTQPQFGYATGQTVYLAKNR